MKKPRRYSCTAPSVRAEAQEFLKNSPVRRGILPGCPPASAKGLTFFWACLAMSHRPARGSAPLHLEQLPTCLSARGSGLPNPARSSPCACRLRHWQASQKAPFSPCADRWDGRQTAGRYRVVQAAPCCAQPWGTAAQEPGTCADACASTAAAASFCCGHVPSHPLPYCATRSAPAIQQACPPAPRRPSAA